MPEKFPSSSPKKAESFSDKKDAIVTHLEKQLKEKNAKYDSIESKEKYYKSNPPLGPIPDEVLRDGGSDLAEWRTQVGNDRQERDELEDNEHSLDYLSRDISELERDLEYIKSMEDYPKMVDEPGGDHGARMFEYLFEKAQTDKK